MELHKLSMWNVGAFLEKNAIQRIIAGVNLNFFFPMPIKCVFVPFAALWVMWSLLCGHLVAFKAPKSWPNKFLINVWGGFSVIFVASYTANIAALIAGQFFHHTTKSYDASVSIAHTVNVVRKNYILYIEFTQRTSERINKHAYAKHISGNK